MQAPSPDQLLAHWQHVIQARMQEILGHEEHRLHQAMRYTALNFGKLFRAKLVLATAHAAGEHSPEAFADLACAVELLHAYSLIHDDLPAMDNDDMRRGRPSCHRQFDEASAILAGDALLTLAFETLTSSPHLPDRIAVRAVRELARHTGFRGMALGQSLDLCRNLTQNAEQIRRIHCLKTGLLIECAVLFGTLKAAQTPKWREPVGRLTGEYFQLVDDLEDFAGGKDCDETNICTVLGVAEVQARVKDIADRLDKLFAAHQADFAPLQLLIEELPAP